MRKFLAAIVVAVLLPFSFATGSQADSGQAHQIHKLERQVKNLRSDVKFWRSEVAYLDGQLSIAQNKPEYRAFANPTVAQSTTLWRVSYSTDNDFGHFDWVSDPLYNRDEVYAFVAYIKADPDTDTDSVKVQSVDLGTINWQDTPVSLP